MNHHDRLWLNHPAVTSGNDRTTGQRAADRMKATLATWTALIGVLVFVIIWMATNGAGVDKFPWILLNLCLSCFAALQCFVLLIANKRGEQIAAELAQHTYENTQQLNDLLTKNTELTQAVHDLTQQVHELVSK